MSKSAEFVKIVDLEVSRASISAAIINAAVRGEQPDGQSMPADGALRGDSPLSSTSESEEQ